MAEVFFDNPPVLNGAEKEQILQLQRYLNAMSEKLNIALMDISIGISLLKKMHSALGHNNPQWHSVRNA